MFLIKTDKIVPEEVEKHLKEKCHSWNILHEFIGSMGEQELFMAICIEKENRNRAHILNRLYQRFAALRKARERLELMS